MRAPSIRSSSIFAVLTLIPSLTAATTLATFQPISGFSTTCDNAYNTPLNGCSDSDVSSGNCSTSCISFLEALTKVLNADCTGTSAYPNTLIAAFFNGQGTETLCPNVLSRGGSGQNQGGGDGSATSVPAVLGHQGGEASVATYATYSFSAVPPTASTTSTSPTETSAATSSSAAAASDNASSAATTTKITFAKTTVMPEATQSLNPSQTSYTSSSSTSKSTSKSSNNGGGGGTILDVSSNASCHNARIDTGVLFLLAGSAGLLGFL